MLAQAHSHVSLAVQQAAYLLSIATSCLSPQPLCSIFQNLPSAPWLLIPPLLWGCILNIYHLSIQEFLGGLI